VGGVVFKFAKPRGESVTQVGGAVRKGDRSGNDQGNLHRWRIAEQKKVFGGGHHRTTQPDGGADI